MTLDHRPAAHAIVDMLIDKVIADKRWKMSQHQSLDRMCLTYNEVAEKLKMKLTIYSESMTIAHNYVPLGVRNPIGCLKMAIYKINNSSMVGIKRPVPWLEYLVVNSKTRLASRGADIYDEETDKEYQIERRKEIRLYEWNDNVAALFKR